MYRTCSSQQVMHKSRFRSASFGQLYLCSLMSSVLMTSSWMLRVDEALNRFNYSGLQQTSIRVQPVGNLARRNKLDDFSCQKGPISAELSTPQTLMIFRTRFVRKLARGPSTPVRFLSKM